MCTRYALYEKPDRLKEYFQIDPTSAYKPTYNAFPTRLLPVITTENRRGFSFFYWGIPPSLSKNKGVSQKLINYDIASRQNQKSFQQDLMVHRCAVPANNYYAWKIKGKKTQIPYRIHLETEQLFSFPGFWAEYEDDQGDQIHTYSIAISPAPSALEAFGSSAPIILDEDQTRIWLDSGSKPADLMELIRSGTQPRLAMHPVSVEINSLKTDSPALIHKTPPADQMGNYTLFD